MAIKSSNHIDLEQKELRNPALHNSSTAPGSPPVGGQIYYKTGTGLLEYYSAILGSGSYVVLAPVDPSTGKISASYLPDSVTGGMIYQGTWDASTNTPTIPAASASNKGDLYKVSVAGTTNIDGIDDWQVGDQIVSNGTTWDKIDNTDLVASVAGKTGAVTLVKADVGLGNVSNALQLIAANNLDDLTNLAQAKINLEINNLTNALQLVAANNLSDLTNAATARQNIGIDAYYQVVPSGNATATITHNLGTEKVIVSLREVSTGDEVLVDNTIVNTNSITLNFAEAPTTNEFEVTIIGYIT